jgi:hypothetical protein
LLLVRSDMAIVALVPGNSNLGRRTKEVAKDRARSGLLLGRRQLIADGSVAAQSMGNGD